MQWGMEVIIPIASVKDHPVHINLLLNLRVRAPYEEIVNFYRSISMAPRQWGMGVIASSASMKYHPVQINPSLNPQCKAPLSPVHLALF